MDTNAQNPTAPTDGSIQFPPVVAPQDQGVIPTEPASVVAQPAVDPVSLLPAPPPIPAAPVGSMHKEAGPTIVEQPIQEVLQPTEQAPKLEAEVIEAGVEIPKNPEVPDLTLHDKSVGVSHAPVIAPVPTQPTGMISIDITKEQAIADVKANKNAKSGKSWIALEVLKMIQKKLLGGGEH
jgi:hypothetical protein